MFSTALTDDVFSLVNRLARSMPIIHTHTVVVLFSTTACVEIEILHVLNRVVNGALDQFAFLASSIVGVVTTASLVVWVSLRRRNSFL